MRLAALGLALTGGALANTTTSPPPDTLSFIIELIVALTGMIAALGAFVLQVQTRRHKDPRDRLLELLLEERREANREIPEPPPAPPRRRRRRSAS